MDHILFNLNYKHLVFELPTPFQDVFVSLLAMSSRDFGDYWLWCSIETLPLLEGSDPERTDCMNLTKLHAIFHFKIKLPVVFENSNLYIYSFHWLGSVRRKDMSPVLVAGT